jgi:uncharacterized protein (TIGR03435 family)
MRNLVIVILAALIPAVAQEPKFEAAEVRVSPTARTFAQNFGGVLREGKYINRDATMLNLITAACGVSEDGVAGPGWISADVFNVVANVPDGTTPAANLMLRSLLAERFKLLTHNGTRPVPRYVLTVGKGGPKLKSGSGTPGCQQQPGTGGPGTPGDLASVPNISKLAATV